MRATVSMAFALLLIGGCEQLGPTGGDPSGAGTFGPDPEATYPSEIPSWLLECGDKKNADTDLQLADLDLTTATWSLPTGFAQSYAYHEENQVETLFSAWYAEPRNPQLPTLNVANVIIYTGLDWGDLADGCGRVPLEAVEKKLAGYREEINARPLTEAQMTEVAGQPAIQQEIGLSDYDYTGYWLFSQTQVLHVYCQWTQDTYRPTLEAGCDELVASVRVG